MFDLFPLFTRIMMASTTALYCCLALVLMRWDAWKRHPVMSVYVTWQAVGGLAGLLIALFAPPMAYFFFYYVVTILGNIIALGVAVELYYNVFDPRMGLTAWRPRHLVIIISMSVVMAIVIALLWTARNGGSWTRMMVTGEEVMTVALWATFCILLIYSRSLGFTWRPRAAGIAIGFLLYLTISVACVFVRARFSLAAAQIAGQIDTAAGFLSLAWWLGVFWGEEKLPKAATYEEVGEMVASYRSISEAAARLL